MAKETIGIVVALTLLGAVVVVRAADHGLSFGGDSSGGFRTLMLYAWGTGSAGPGQARIPVPAHGATYEVIVSKPGEPQPVLLAGNADGPLDAR